MSGPDHRSATKTVVRVRDGAEVGSAVHTYRHAVMDRTLTTGPAAATAPVQLPPDWALQVPDDYVEVLRTAVPAAVRAAGIAPTQVIGIGTDFTACTILPTLRDGTPLCELPELRNRHHSWVKLWKHHAAQPHADRINALAHERGEPWIGRYGGKISAEWQFAKGLQLLEEDPEMYRLAQRWIEAADWIYGVTMEEPGVSTIVGVRLDQALETARGTAAQAASPAALGA